MVLHTINGAAAAYELPGLSSATRSLALAEPSLLFGRLLGSRPFQVAALPKSIDGISTENAPSFVINEGKQGAGWNGLRCVRY